MPTAQPVARRYAGIVKEATKGTAVPTMVDFIPFKTFEWTPHVNMLPDEGARGSMVTTYGHVQGTTHSELDMGGDVFLDVIGYPLAGVLGDVAVTGAGAPFTHTMAVKNSGDGQPVSDTLDFYYVASVKQFAAVQWSELGFTFNADGLLEYSAKAFAMSPTTPSVPTPSFTSLAPVPNWQLVTTIGGSASALVEEGEVHIARNVEPIFTGNGAQDPYQLFAGPAEVTGRAVLVMTDDTYMTSFLTNTQPTLDFLWSQGAGAALTSLQLHFTKAAQTSAKAQFGKKWVEVNVEFTGDGNSTDVGASAGYSPVKAVLKNAKASGTFA